LRRKKPKEKQPKLREPRLLRESESLRLYAKMLVSGWPLSAMVKGRLLGL